MHSSPVTSSSPSFTVHSSNNLADVAARVVEEFRHENGGQYDHLFNSNDYGYGYDYDNNNEEFSVTSHEAVTHQNKMIKENDDDDEFEFAVVCNDINSASISGDEMFQYPLFDQSLLLDVNPEINNLTKKTESNYKQQSQSYAARLSLRKLFSEERDFCSSSSSEADDLDGIASGTYCVWKPKPELRKKSNSTGNSSGRWKYFRDILYRSHSDSKESPFLFFKHSVATNKDGKVKKVAKIAAPDDDDATPEKRDPACLPAGQALATAFTNVSRSNRNLHIF